MARRGNRDTEEVQEAQKDLKHRGAIRQLFDGAAKEFGFAVEDVRNELVSRAWFDRDENVMSDAFRGLDERDQDQQGIRDYSSADAYGRDIEQPDWEQIRDSAQERNSDPRADIWAQEKAKAEREFGHAPGTKVSAAEMVLPHEKPLTHEDVYGQDPFKEFDHGLGDIGLGEREHEIERDDLER